MLVSPFNSCSIRFSGSPQSNDKQGDEGRVPQFKTRAELRAWEEANPVTYQGTAYNSRDLFNNHQYTEFSEKKAGKHKKKWKA